ncbi:MAG TPA: hypothetical protein PL124_02925 [Candidatus Cloacimonadota bacterium]|nr:hypothetical protein [Candidatus Cloacimonadota bacterium]
MNINTVYADVRLCIPNATLVEMNKYLQQALQYINSRGLERKVVIPVVTATGTYNADPLSRTASQTFNYYPLTKCLIVPSTISNVQRVYVDGIEVPLISFSDHIKGTYLTQTYCQTESGELYFTVSLTDASVVSITGRAGSLTPSTLPDRFIPYLANSIIAGLYSDEYKDSDQYAVYLRKANEGKAYAFNVEPGKVQNIRRNGRLY